MVCCNNCHNCQGYANVLIIRHYEVVLIWHNVKVLYLFRIRTVHTKYKECVLLASDKILPLQLSVDFLSFAFGSSWRLYFCIRQFTRIVKFTFITQCDENKTLHPPPPQLTLRGRYLGCHEERRCVTTLITAVKDYDFFERVSSKTLCAFPTLSL